MKALVNAVETNETSQKYFWEKCYNILRRCCTKTDKAGLWHDL